MKLGFASGGTDQRAVKWQVLPLVVEAVGQYRSPNCLSSCHGRRSIRVLSLENETHLYEKLIDFVPELIGK